MPAEADTGSSRPPGISRYDDAAGRDPAWPLLIRSAQDGGKAPEPGSPTRPASGILESADEPRPSSADDLPRPVRLAHRYPKRARAVRPSLRSSSGEWPEGRRGRANVETEAHDGRTSWTSGSGRRGTAAGP